MKIIKAKKAVAGLDFMQNLAIGVFVILMLFFVMAIVGANLINSATTTTSYSIVNENGWINATGYRLNNASTVTGSYGFAISRITNNSILILAGNYTLNSSGYIFNATAKNYNNAKINYSYSVNTENAGASIARNFTAAIGGFGSNISLWLTLGGIVVLIGIVVVIIVMMRRSNMGGAANL